MPHRASSSAPRSSTLEVRHDQPGPSKGNSMNNPSSFLPTDFPFPANFNFQPKLWTGGSNPDAGLLGFQAPAADGNETFTAPPSPVDSAPPRPLSPPLKKHLVTRPPPQLPVEMHALIVAAALAASPCSWCRLATAAALAAVSPLYRRLLEAHLYQTLDLRFRQPCDAHFPASSALRTLDARLPLLTRTLASRPDLARAVRTLLLPARGINAFLSCHAEKFHLPALLRLCVNLERIDGLDLLTRPFFAGEHYCLDDRPRQHGMVAWTLVREAAALRCWRWEGGMVQGADWWARMFDCHPGAEGIGFAEMHVNWRCLQELVLRDVWGVDAGMLAATVGVLPRLRRLELVRVRTRRLGRMEGGLVAGAVGALAGGVRELTLGELRNEGVREVGEAVGGRFSPERQLEKLRILGTPVDPDSVKALLLGISVPPRPQRRFDGGVRTGREYRRSVVRGLELSVEKGEDVCWGGFLEDFEVDDLIELDWRVPNKRGMLRGMLGACTGVQKLRILEEEEKTVEVRDAKWRGVAVEVAKL